MEDSKAYQNSLSGHHSHDSTTSVDPSSKHIQDKFDLNKSSGLSLLQSLLLSSISNSSLCFFWINAKGRFIDASRSAIKCLGYSKKDLLGISISDIDSNYKHNNYFSLMKSKVNEEVFSFKTSYVSKEKASFAVNATVEFFKENGFEFLLVSWVRELGDKASNASINVREKRYESLLSSLTEGVLMLNSSHKIDYANNAAAKMLGYTLEELLGRSLDGLMSTHNYAVFHASAIELKSRASIKYDLEFQGRDVPPFYASVSMSPMSTGAENDIGVMLSFSDISARKTMELESESVRRELEQKTVALEQKTIDLRYILEEIAAEKKKIKDNVVGNVENVLLPLLKKVRARDSSYRYLAALEDNLNNITSSYGRKAAAKLTSREIEICSLIKQGHGTKEIAEVLHVSKRTIDFHRDNIRKKLKIPNRKESISSYL